MAVTSIGTVMMRMGVDTRAWFKGLNEAQKGLVSFGASMQVAGVRIAAIWGATLGAASVASFKFGKDFETAFAGIRKTIDASEMEFAKIRKGILNLSEATPFAATELSNLARIGGQLGVQQENIVGFTEAIAKLGVAAVEINAEEAAIGLARLIALTKNSQKDFGRLGSVLARLGDSLETTEARILNFGERISSVAGIAGISAQDILGIAGAFSAVTRGVESGSTAVIRAIGAIDSAVAEGGGKLRAFAAVTLQTSEQFAEAWKVDAAGAFTTFIEGLGRIEAEGGNVHAVLEGLSLQSIRTKQALLAAAGSGSKLGDALASARKEFAENIKLNKVFDEQMKTVGARLTVIFNVIKRIGIKIFDAFHDQIITLINGLEGLVRWLSQAAEIFETLPSFVKFTMIAIVGLTGVIGPLLIAVGAVISTALGVAGIMSFLGGSIATTAVTTAAATSTIGAFTGTLGTYSATLGGAATATTAAGTSIGALAGFMGLALSGGLLLAGGILKITNFLRDTEDPTLKAAEGFGIFEAAAIALSEAMDIASFSPFLWVLDQIREKWEAWRGAADFPQTPIPMIDKITEAFIDQAVELAKLSGETDAFVASLTTLERAQKFIAGTLDETTERAKQLGVELRLSVRESLVLTNTEKLLAAATKVMGEDIKDSGRAMTILTEQMTLLKEPIPVLVDFIEQMNLGLTDTAIDASNAAAQLRAFTKAAEDVERKKRLKESSARIAAGIPGVLSDIAAVFGADPLSAAEKFTRDLYAAMAAEAATLGSPFDVFAVPGLNIERFLSELIGDAERKTNSWSASLRDVSRAFKLVGIEADSTLGRIMGSLVVAASAGENLANAFKIKGADGVESLEFSWQGVTQAILAGAEAVGAFMAATEEASAGKRALGGLAVGAQIGTSIKPGLGTAIGAGVGALVAWLSTPSFQERMRDVGEAWGIAISVGMGQRLQDVKDALNLTDITAPLVLLGEIIGDIGGVTGDNIDNLQAMFARLIISVQTGAIGAAEGLKAIGEAFVAMADSFEDAGIKGALAMAEIIQMAEKFGKVTQSMTDFITQQVDSALGHLSTFFESFITELKDGTREVTITADSAAGVLQWMGAAFAAALKSTGSLYQAILLLPEAFKELLPALREILGEENALLNTLANYYNFVTENSKQLGALTALGDAFKELLSIGVITAANLPSLTASFKELFESIGDSQTALLMMGPQIGMLLEAFKRLGLEPPEWLKELAEAAIEAGATLEPPPTVLSVLEAIRDMLHAIALELGAIDAIDIDIDVNGTGTGNGLGGKPPPDDTSSLAGGLAPTVFTKPTGLTVGDAGPEMVQAVPLGDIDSQDMVGGTSPSVHITFQGPVFGDLETFHSAVRESVNEGFRRNLDDVRTESRIANGVE